MPATYIPIQSTTLSSSAATVTFSSIPQTYTDLCVRYAVRDDLAGNTGNSFFIALNSSASGHSNTYIRGNGATVSTGNNTTSTSWTVLYATSATATSNTFASGEFYFPNYTASTAKQGSIFNAHETNATTAFLFSSAHLFNNTAAVTSITFTANSASFVAGSTFHLYGIKKD